MTEIVEAPPVITPPIEQLEEIKVIKKRKPRQPKHDFKDGSGRVPAHKHDNGGGWVADTAAVDDCVYIGRRCEIFNRATVKGPVRLEGTSRISGSAVVSGGVTLRNSGQIYGKAVVRDTTIVEGNARIFGQAHVSGTSRLYHTAYVNESAQVFSTTMTGDVRIGGNALVVRSTLDGGSVGMIEIKGDCSVIHGIIRGRALVENQAQLIRSQINNHHQTAAVNLRDFAVVADQSSISYPIVLRDHVVLIHSIFSVEYGDYHTMADNIVTLNQRSVFQHQEFRTRASLQNYLNLLAQYGGRLGAAQIMPNGQVANFPARRISAEPAGPRRLMRLQEATS